MKIEKFIMSFIIKFFYSIFHWFPHLYSIDRALHRCCLCMCVSWPFFMFFVFTYFYCHAVSCANDRQNRKWIVQIFYRLTQCPVYGKRRKYVCRNNAKVRSSIMSQFENLITQLNNFFDYSYQILRLRCVAKKTYFDVTQMKVDLAKKSKWEIFKIRTK